MKAAYLVVGGDFNTIWDSEKDCLPPRPNNRSVLPELNNLCFTFDLMIYGDISIQNKFNLLGVKKIFLNSHV